MVNSRVLLLVIVFSLIGLFSVAVSTYLLFQGENIEETTEDTENFRVDKQECSDDSNCKPSEICSKSECICRSEYNRIKGDCVVKPLEEKRVTTEKLITYHENSTEKNDHISNETRQNNLSERPGDYLLVNQDNSTYKIIFENPDEYERIYTSNSQTVFGSMTIDCKNRTVYSIIAELYGCTGKYNITRMSYDGTDHEVFIENVGCPESLAIDWISRNIFWTEFNKSQIIVANLDSKKTKVLAEENIFIPRSIVVHPGRGKIFWADAQEDYPKIEVANQDGSHRKIFWHEPKITPFALAIDWISDELCWSNNYHQISCTSLYSGPIKIVSRSFISFNIDVSAEHYFWIKYQSKEIHRLNKKNRRQVAIHASGIGFPYGIVAIPLECPKYSNKCEHEHGGCNKTQLCLPIGRTGRSCY